MSEPTRSDEYLTVPQVAALCREKCGRPAQGHDDGTLCGAESHSDDGPVFAFCGRHWGVVLDAYGEEPTNG